MQSLPTNKDVDPQKWEYISRTHWQDDPTEWLNKYGCEGWELVSAMRSNTALTQYIFKRPLQEETSK